MEEELFYVQDTRTIVGNTVMWWCPDGKGYTCDLKSAGKYTAAECRKMRVTDVPWPCKQVDAIATLQVDVQKLRP